MRRSATTWSASRARSPRPIGGGIRSLNVALRQNLDLYVCLRPVRWFTGVPSPVLHPEKVDMVIFRENTEDVYAGLELQDGTPRSRRLVAFLREEFGWEIRRRLGHRHQAGLGVSAPSAWCAPPSSTRSATKRKSVTLVHKGNIQKFTEGAFREWGYELVREEFADVAVGLGRLRRQARRQAAGEGRHRRHHACSRSSPGPTEFDVIATTNLNGDYLSDALAAQVGGIGIAPGANINYVTGHAIFEATHGTAPKYAGKDKVNPGSVILSGVMMFEHLGWDEAAPTSSRALEATIADEGRHLRLRAPHGGRHRGEVLGVRRRHRRSPLRLGSGSDRGRFAWPWPLGRR